MRGLVMLVLSALLVPAWVGIAHAQPCPDTPPCGACLEDVATATCKPRPQPRQRRIEITSSPPGAEIWVSVNNKPPRKKGVTPKKLTFRQKDTVRVNLRLTGYLAWDREIPSGDDVVQAQMELDGLLTIDPGGDPAVHGSRVTVQCRSGSAWASCHTFVAAPQPCCQNIRFRGNPRGRVVIEREGYQPFAQEWGAGTARPRVRPRLVPSGPSRDDFSRSSLGRNYVSTGGYSIEGNALRSYQPQNNPLWMTLGLPHEAVIDLVAWTSSATGDIKLHAWGDGSWRPGRSGSPGYIFILGGWANTKSMLVRDDEVRGVKVERAGAVTLGQRHHLRIVRRGATIDWYVDDLMTPFLTLTDPAPRPAGSPGFLGFSGWGSDVRFDDLSITPLSLAPGRVRVEASTGASVRRRGGGSLGSTPWEGDLPPGRHELVVSAPGFRDEVLTVEVAAGRSQRLAATLRRAEGVLAVSVNTPASVRVRRVDGRGGERTESISASSSLSLAPGRYELAASAGGYLPATVVVDVVDGQTAFQTISLERAPVVTESTTTTTLRDTGGYRDEPYRDTATPKTVDKPRLDLPPQVRSARARYVTALRARDSVSEATVRLALGNALVGTCVAGGIVLNVAGAASASESLGTNLLLIGVGGVAAGACYWGLLKSIRRSSYRSRSGRQADSALRSARAELNSAMDTYLGKRRSSLLRRPQPRLGFGLTLADGFAFGPTTDHAGLQIEAGLHLNLRWFHPELALEADPGDEIVVLRPGVRLSLGRWFFLRGAGEIALAGGDESWNLFGGLGVDLWLSRLVAFEIAGDYTHSLAETDGVSFLRARMGIRFGL